MPWDSLTVLTQERSPVLLSVHVAFKHVQSLVKATVSQICTAGL